MTVLPSVHPVIAAVPSSEFILPDSVGHMYRYSWPSRVCLPACKQPQICQASQCLLYRFAMFKPRQPNRIQQMITHQSLFFQLVGKNYQVKNKVHIGVILYVELRTNRSRAHGVSEVCKTPNCCFLSIVSKVVSSLPVKSARLKVFVILVNI